MKIYVITDLEGPALINRFTQTRDVTPEEKRRSEALLTGEVNACVDGILDACPGADVVVWDGHGSGGIDELNFHPRARLIARGPIRAPYFLDETYDALFFVGQHARAGSGGVLCHSYSSKTIEWIRLNGREMGEFGCRALMAGLMGVPTVFISGDDTAVEEARELVPEIVGVAVKQALGVELALHLSRAEACRRIRAGAAEAVRRIEKISPFVMPPPFVQEIRFKEGVSIEGWLKRGFEAVDERTVRKCSDNLLDLHV